MKIRAITLGQNIRDRSKDLKKIKENLIKIQSLKQSFEKTNIEVQYIRFAGEPFSKQSDVNKDEILANRHEILTEMDSLVEEELLGIYSFCPGLCDQSTPLTISQKMIIDELPILMKSHSNMFSSLQVASTQQGINFEAVKAGAQIIQHLSTPDPFQNVQFAVTFNVKPNTPFFPSAYHQGMAPKLSIALEAADEMVKILENYPPTQYSLSKIKEQIHNRFEAIYDQIANIAAPFCEENKITFEGIDFSPAPYPTQEKSIGTVLEKLQFSHFGETGSVFAVGFLTEALQSTNRPKIGFSGFMQPLLEDYTISLRNNEDKVDISKLVLLSTMCGLGLDCIPIPGDTDIESIELLLLDLAMISIRLKKPLTARLMPIPNKKAGESTEFKFEFFTDSKICQLKRSHSKINDISIQNISYNF
ncbi:hypothetical protein NEF87_004980 [Candidatus Lokiarchaeum ossiferum]|uniref:DUF711 family protein n=1 Tax=Candidatus Lokiarchaeum ossiferum TaxID=2951803 RepID=A0ABY6HZ36_9ARCH|nr:hypothetical protein NEF87_004980 [Candidatus Lokiarchaeum sp. B-35]